MSTDACLPLVIDWRRRRTRWHKHWRCVHKCGSTCSDVVFCISQSLCLLFMRYCPSKIAMPHSPVRSCFFPSLCLHQCGFSNCCTRLYDNDWLLYGYGHGSRRSYTVLCSSQVLRLLFMRYRSGNITMPQGLVGRCFFAPLGLHQYGFSRCDARLHHHDRSGRRYVM